MEPLDLIDQILDEEGLLTNLKNAFDRGEFPKQVLLNSDTCLKIISSAHLSHRVEDDGDYIVTNNYFDTPFGEVQIVPISRKDRA